MLERNFTVKQAPSKNCFCYLSPKVIKNLIYKDFIKIVCTSEKTIYLSLGPFLESVEEYEVGLNGLYLKALGIKDGETVVLSEVPELPEITSVSVSPLTQNDYEVVELMSNEIQSTLLTQLKVVATGQKFVAWVGNSISVTLHVDYIFPTSPGYMDDMTSVVIKEPNAINSLAEPAEDNSVIKETPTSNDNLKNHERSKSKSDQCDLMEKYLFQKDDVILRIVPSSYLTKLHDLFSDGIFSFNAFVFRSSMPKEWAHENTASNVTVASIKPIRVEEAFTNNTKYIRLCIIEDFIEDNDFDLVFNDNIFIHDTLFQNMNSKLGERLILKHVNHVNLPTVREVKNELSNALQNIKSKLGARLIVKQVTYVNPPTVGEVENELSVDDSVEKFKTVLADACDKHSFVVLNPNIQFFIEKKIPCLLDFVPSEAKMCLVDQDFLRNCKFSGSKYPVPYDQPVENKSEEDEFLTDVSNFDDIIEDSIIQFLAKMRHSYQRQNLIIAGKLGSGKSTLLKIISNKLSSCPYFAYVETVSCKTLKGKTIESLHKTLSGVVINLVNRQPSVLILDDLHIICKYIRDDRESLSQNGLYYNRNSEMLHNMLATCTNNNLVTIIATTTSICDLNSYIHQSRGSHLFQSVCEIADLNKKDKLRTLGFMFSKYKTENINFEDFAIKMEGFVMQDCVNFVTKAFFASLKKVQDKMDNYDSIENIMITESNCEEALKNTVVLSLDKVSLHSPGNKDFTDIGGLEDVKKILIESLLWPTKYSSIFDNAPLRLQSGLLLYGPPGTGKTILAAAAAKHCGLRLISVKGPELLSKYIGASEQAVRQIFEKAQCARPCILFFDEFDSFAPRRGHDNTGVTDRVVNQLLTQLDGVESLSGVCVLAATSRPDLLDPALLRPGRLDRQIKCPLPDKDARLAILKALSKSMRLAADVNLEEISSNSEGFSGADLQSVLYTAQLSSVEHLFADNKEYKHDVLTEVTQYHLEEALKKTRPSLSKQEKAKYDRIYKIFEGGNPLLLNEIGQKSTLA